MIARYIIYFIVAVILGVISGCCTSNIPNLNPITGTITHATCNNAAGSITQNWIICNPNDVSPSYLWSNGAISKDLTNVPPNYPGVYTCDVNYSILGVPMKTPKYEYTVLYDTEWKDADKMNYNSGTKEITRNTIDPLTVGDICSSNSLPENSVGYVQFTISVSSKSLNFTRFGFIPDGNCDSWYDPDFVGVEFNSQTMQYYLIGTGFTSKPHKFASGDVFKIEYGNGVKIFQNGSYVDGFGPASFLVFFTHPKLKLACGIITPTMQIKNVRTTFGCSEPTDYYAELVKELDGSCYTMTNGVRFKYREKYNDPVLDYAIYNWKRNVVLTSSQMAVTAANTAGINYHLISLSGSAVLNSGEVYFLEVKNDKGEIYRMRFRYYYVPSASDIALAIGDPPDWSTVPVITKGIWGWKNPTTGFNTVVDIMRGQDYQ